MDLENVLQNIPSNASETIVEQNLSQPFLKALRFGNLEILPQFPVGRKAVDQAVKKNTENDLLLHTENSPFFYMEVKGRTENLSEQYPDYVKASVQLNGHSIDNDGITESLLELHKD